MMSLVIINLIYW